MRESSRAQLPAQNPSSVVHEYPIDFFHSYRQPATSHYSAVMLRPPPSVSLRPSAPRASPLPPPRAANPNTDSATTKTPSAAAAGAAGNMGAAAWWRRALGQRFNPAGVAAVAAVAASEPRLALPHASVQDIRWLDWAELRRAGFRGVVFDKDNTLTAPYAPALWPPLAAAFDQCRAAFPPGALAIYSNSAGLAAPTSR
jgi:phosphatidylglycerophosphatase GEP4